MSNETSKSTVRKKPSVWENPMFKLVMGFSVFTSAAGTIAAIHPEYSIYAAGAELLAIALLGLKFYSFAKNENQLYMASEEARKLHLKELEIPEQVKQLGQRYGGDL